MSGTEDTRRNVRLGRRGEEIAAQYLVSRGYRILRRNVWTSYGEIDLIAEDGEALVFVEVKTRRNARFGTPAEAVSPRKQASLCRAALTVMQESAWLDRPCRFDVVAIVIRGTSPRITHLPNAFACDEGAFGEPLDRAP